MCIRDRLEAGRNGVVLGLCGGDLLGIGVDGVLQLGAHGVQLVLLETVVAVALELGDELLGLRLCAPKHLPRLLLGLAQLGFALFVNLAAQLFGLVAQLLRCLLYTSISSSAAI